jgi:hypothetical protein
MLHRIWVSLQCDLRINWRNGFVLVTAAVALVCSAGFVWFIPSNASIRPTVYLFDGTADRGYASYAMKQAASGAGKLSLVASDEAVRAALGQDKSGVGIALQDGASLPQARLYTQQHHSSRVQRLLAVSLQEQLRVAYGRAGNVGPAVRTVVLREPLSAAVSFRDAWAPLLLFTDPALIGLIFIGVLVFAEKDEGTLRAYLVTPGRTWEFLVAKALSLAALAVLFSLIMLPLTIGARPNYGHVLALIIAGSLFSSLLGAWISVRFDNISQFLFPAVGVVLLLGLPGLSYFLPSFTPWWLRIIPTYAMVFGLREAAFATGSPEIVWQGVLILLASSAAILPLASRAFDRHFARR